MPKILANDGLAASAIAKLETAGFEVVTDKIAQEDLSTELNNFDGIVVRSATTVRKELIDACPNLKFIGRAGVGMDNIDVAYAREKGLTVNNTPAASSQSVAELVFAHMFSISRFLFDANRNMPANGASDFKSLKKSYSKGVELRGRTLGIIGFGRIGQAVGRMALGLGMKIKAYNIDQMEVNIDLQVMEVEGAKLSIPIKTCTKDELLAEADFITLHVPFSKGDKPILDMADFVKMKDGVCIVNTARGGAVNEIDLISALDDGKVRHAALDVFENEPSPLEEILTHPKISLTPHIGASTGEAQTRIGDEMAENIIRALQ